MHIFKVASRAAAAAITITVVTILSSAASAAGLFDAAPVAEARTARPSPATTAALRHRLVRLNTEELARILPAAADQAADRLERARGLSAQVTLDLFPGVSVTAERADLDAPETGGFVWTGKGTGPRSAFVTLVVNEGEVLGHIQTGGKLYSIEPVSGGLHRVIEINQKLIRDDIHVNPPASFLKPRSEAAPPAEDTRVKTTINVMVAHTAAARAEVGTVNQMQQRINMGIALANTAYVNSGVKIKLVRVGDINEINYADMTLYGGATTSANYLGALCDLSNFNCASSGVANTKTATFNALRAKRYRRIDAQTRHRLRHRVAWRLQQRERRHRHAQRPQHCIFGRHLDARRRVQLCRGQYAGPRARSQYGFEP
jgi:hypothetical protein